MRDFCKVSPTIWRSQKFSRLDKSDQLLYFYFLTCTHGNSIGCFYLPIAYAAIDLRTAENTLKEGIERVSGAGLISYDEQEQIVLIHNWLTFNEPMNPKHGQKIASDIAKIPSVDFKRQVAHTFNAVSQAKGWSVTASEQNDGKGIERVSTQRLDKTETKTETETRKSKASRLPENWTLPDDWRFYAASQGFSDAVYRLEADKFRDYWIAQPGQKGVKLDWFATWRNWLRNARPGTHTGAKTTAEPPRKQFNPADYADEEAK